VTKGAKLRWDFRAGMNAAMRKRASRAITLTAVICNQVRVE
jgi:hypothetical protein